MHAAGLIEMEKGVRIINGTSDNPWFSGLPTRLCATAELLELAASHAVTAASVKSDWKVSREAEVARINVADGDLLVCRAFGKGAPRMDIRPDQRAEAEAMLERLVALNEHIARAEIRGCRPPVLRRSFRVDLRLQGRFYAIGGSNYQAMPREDRAEMRINGEPIVEVDIHACALTMLLGVTGVGELPTGDLYSAVGLPREAVKAWFVQTFGTGAPISQWASDTAEEIKRAVKPSVIRDAAMRTYPVLGNMCAILPDDLVAKLLPARLGWGVGQYLTNLERRMMDRALADLLSRRVMALPLHDCVIVPASDARIAKAALDDACREVAGITPRVKA